jgi:hypothetical protein
MIVRPAVTVHGMDDALAALAPGAPVTLLSAPGAASVGGCLWWRSLVEAAIAAWPATPCDDILDCGDSPGWAMAALRIGQRALVLDPACPAFAAVAGAAGTLGARVLAARPVSLDLGQPRARARLATWLRP